MRKVIFGAVVVVLAGTCWVLAQSASSNRSPSPYNPQTTPSPKATPAVDKVTIAADAPPTVAPPTEIKIPDAPVNPPPAPQIEMPVIPPPPVLTAPSSPTMPVIPILPPNDAPAGAPPAPPVLSLPNALPVPMTAPPAVSPVQPSANNAPEIAPIIPPVPPPMMAPLIPSNDPPADRRVIRPETKSALPGISLPAVPGVPPPPPGIPNLVGPVAQGNGMDIVAPPSTPVPDPVGGAAPGTTPPSTGSVLPAWQAQPPATLPTGQSSSTPPQRIWTDNDPAYWKDRQQFETPSSVRVWASADYLLWWVKGTSAPPLVQAVVGVQPGQNSFNSAQSINLYPSGAIDYKPLNGVRGTLGFWFDDKQTIGLEGSYFWFWTTSLSNTDYSAPGVILGRPFINTTNGAGGLFQLSNGGSTNGGVIVRDTLGVQGGDVNFLSTALPIGQRLTALAGFRYLQITEGLNVYESTANPGTGFASSSYDAFNTRNQFYGGQVGLRWIYDCDRFFMSLTGKFAYGAMEEHVNINGGTYTVVPGAGLQTANGGVLALPTNMGEYSRTHMSFVPEAIAAFGYQLAPWATMSLGYNFMYVHDVVRAGRQIDAGVNPANLPFGPGSTTNAQPAFSFRGDSLWMQGVNVGVTFSY